MDLGWYECPSCGIKYIHDTAIINIWASADDALTLVEISCSGCGTLVIDHLPLFEIASFGAKGSLVKQYNDKFKAFSEDEINKWDPTEDFYRCLKNLA